MFSFNSENKSFSTFSLTQLQMKKSRPGKSCIWTANEVKFFQLGTKSVVEWNRFSCLIAW